jgi:4-hydroxybenzoate polyprenyltransferase
MNFGATIRLIRPKHWVKNIFVLAPLIFAGKLSDLGSLVSALIAFISFCAAASAVYTFNDIKDLELDKLHPGKCIRPLASGELSTASAWKVCAILLAISIAGTVYLTIVGGYAFAVGISLYLAVNIYYTLIGKTQVIVDAFCIAVGFVLRVIAGAYAIGVEPTGWIVVTTFFLSLFLGFGKRRGEIVRMQEDSPSHREVLSSYPLNLLDQIIVSTGTIAIISYALYTLDAGVIDKFGSPRLYYTIIPVAYGVFRYMYLLLKGDEGDPTEVLMKDTGLLFTVLIWLISAAGIVYIDGGHFR